MQDFSLLKKHLILSSWAFLFVLGCTTIQNKRLPFSAFVGQEVTLVRPCVLNEYVTGGQKLDTYWQNGQPTELVFDDRLFAKPVKRIPHAYGDWPVYPVADYSRRTFDLAELPTPRDFADYEKNGGPYRVHELPVGTKVFIQKAYTQNNIDSIRHQADGEVTLPQSSQKVRFTYTFGRFPSASSASETIKRAPWEDESVPEKRFVGWNGKMYDPSK